MRRTGSYNWDLQAERIRLQKRRFRSGRFLKVPHGFGLLHTIVNISVELLHCNGRVRLARFLCDLVTHCIEQSGHRLADPVVAGDLPAVLLHNIDQLILCAPDLDSRIELRRLLLIRVIRDLRQLRQLFL